MFYLQGVTTHTILFWSYSISHSGPKIPHAFNHRQIPVLFPCSRLKFKEKNINAIIEMPNIITCYFCIFFSSNIFKMGEKELSLEVRKLTVLTKSRCSTRVHVSLPFE